METICPTCKNVGKVWSDKLGVMVACPNKKYHLPEPGDDDHATAFEGTLMDGLEDATLDDPYVPPGEPILRVSLPPAPHGMTLADAQDALAEQLEDGTRCPCCDQHAQIYRWSLYATAVKALIALYKKGGTTTFIESKTLKPLVPSYQGDMSRLRHWGLAEQESERRPDGGKSGFWRVTSFGEAFVLGYQTIPKYVWIYSGRVLASGGERCTIKDTLGKKFDYDAMMRGEF